MRAPGSRFSASVGNVVAIKVALPAMSRGVMVSFCPVLSCTGMRFFNRPVRIFGPCKSPRMQIGLPSSRETLRTISISLSFSGWVPWEKFSRATSSPARTSSRKTASVLQDGPSVATILARRLCSAGRLLDSIRVKLIRPPYCLIRRRSADLQQIQFYAYSPPRSSGLLTPLLTPRIRKGCGGSAARNFNVLSRVALAGGHHFSLFHRRRFGQQWLCFGEEMRVELGPQQHAYGGDIEPHQRGHHRHQRAVDHGVVGKAGEIKAEAQGGQKPDQGGARSSR